MKGQVKESIFKNGVVVEFTIRGIQDIQSGGVVERIRITLDCVESSSGNSLGVQSTTLPVGENRTDIRERFFEPFVLSALNSGVIDANYDTDVDFDGATGTVKLTQNGNFLNASDWNFFQAAPALPPELAKYTGNRHPQIDEKIVLGDK